MALTMTLNGSNYVSDRTRGAFDQALEETRIENHESRIMNQRKSTVGCYESADQPTTHNPQPTTHNPQLLTLNSQLATLDHALAQSYEHQTLTMRVHEQYLNNQGEYARLFGQLMQQQGTIFAQAAAIPQQAQMTAAVLETLASSMARFHDLQEQTLDVHRQFLAQQSDYARATIQLLTGQADGEWQMANGEWQMANGEWQMVNGESQPAIVESPKSKVESLPVQSGETVKRGNGNGNGNGNGHHPKEATSSELGAENLKCETQSSIQHPVSSIEPPAIHTPQPTTQNPQPGTLIPSLLDIVSDKTGYPADMLELDMDMEADLGIDSIKRVEILGALQDAHPDLPEVATDVLADMRTLRQIVERMQEAGGKGQESADPRIGESADSEPATRDSKKA